MIQLDKDWYIDADPYQYVLFKRGKEYKDKGFAKLDATYHPTLEHAVVRYTKIKEADLISSEDRTLPEAIKALRKLTAEIEKLRNDIQNN